MYVKYIKSDFSFNMINIPCYVINVKVVFPL